MFRLTGDRLAKIPSGETGWVYTVYPDTPGGWLIQAEKGWFRLTEDGLVKIPGDETGRVNKVYRDAPGGWLIRALI